MKIPRTLGEIEALDLEILTCEQVSKVLKADPYSIHKQAEADAASLGFPVIICGTSKTFEDTGEIVSCIGKVKVLKPVNIPKMDFDDLEDFIKEFREMYEEEYEEIFEEVEKLNK